MKNAKVIEPFGLFFNLIFTVALLISRLLHPVSVQGLEYLPRHGACWWRTIPVIGTQFCWQQRCQGTTGSGSWGRRSCSEILF